MYISIYIYIYIYNFTRCPCAWAYVQLFLFTFEGRWTLNPCYQCTSGKEYIYIYRYIYMYIHICIYVYIAAADAPWFQYEADWVQLYYNMNIYIYWYFDIHFTIQRVRVLTPQERDLPHGRRGWEQNPTQEQKIARHCCQRLQQRMTQTRTGAEQKIR